MNRWNLTDIERFESKYIPEPNTGCWLWIGSTMVNKNGTIRPIFRYKRRGKLAYRWFREYVTKEKLPPHLGLCHKCDTPLCVNLEHLFIGTAMDNSLDRRNKGRNFWNKTKQKCGFKHRTVLTKDERCFFCRQKQAQERNIRNRHTSSHCS